MTLSLNPYVAGNPLKDGRTFFGRQDTLAWVNNNLRNLGTNALVLFGQRRIGKTSLLLQLQHNLPAKNFLAVYVDLQDTSTLPLGRLLAYLANTAAERAKLELPDNMDFDNHGHSFRLKFLPWFLKQLGENRRLVFLLDEFDVLDQTAEIELPPDAASKSLQPFLRRLMNEEPSLAFVFVSGRHPNDLHVDFSATFKASLSRELWLLNRSSAIQLIRLAEANRTLHYTEAAVERIVQLTNGHPYLTQLLCQCLWEHAHVRATTEIPIVDIADVESAIPIVIETGSNALDWLWKGLQPAERIYAAALAEIASENQPITEDQVVAVLSTYAARLRTREVELAPRDLVARHVIEADDARQAGERTTYRFAVELFRLWVKEKQPLHQAKDDLDRVDEFADQLFAVAYNHFRHGAWQQAFDSFEQVLQRNPYHLKASIYLGETLLELKRLQDAIEIFQKAYSLDPQDARQPLARAWSQIAQQRASISDVDGTLQACAETLKLSPNERTIQDLQLSMLVKRGDSFFAEGNWAVALVAYQKAHATEKIEQFKNLSRDEWISTGDIALDRQDWDASLAAFEQAEEFEIVNVIRRDPNLISVCNALANLYKERGDFEQAKKYLYKIKDLDDENASNSLLTVIRTQIVSLETNIENASFSVSVDDAILSLYQEAFDLQTTGGIKLLPHEISRFQLLKDKKRRQNIISKLDELISIKDDIPYYQMLQEYIELEFEKVRKSTITKKNFPIDIETSIRDLFINQLMGAVAGLDAIFLVDLNTAEVIVSYPEKESQPDSFIAEICGITAVQIEQKARSNQSELALTSMEISIPNRRVATYRITPTWLICLLGKEETFRPAFAKRLCEGPIKDEIENLMAQHNIAG